MAMSSVCCVPSRRPSSRRPDRRDDDLVAVLTTRGVPVRKLAPEDAGWAADLMERRRLEYAGYSPVFWRPATGVRALHTAFLERQIRSDANIALRTDNGFIIGQRRHNEVFVDDFAVGSQDAWGGDGAALLLEACKRFAVRDQLRAVRVVTAHADKPKSAMLIDLSLRVCEQWWVRELRPSGPPDRVGRIEHQDVAGVLATAPPVYDPGGRVFLADSVEGSASTARIAERAAELGAVLAVIPAEPGAERAADLREEGWHIASEWYVGWPEAYRRHSA
jgi:hypothetical protein